LHPQPVREHGHARGDDDPADLKPVEKRNPMPRRLDPVVERHPDRHQDDDCEQHGHDGARHHAPSHFATTAVARQLPTTFVIVRPMSSSASIPRIVVTPSSGRPYAASVPVRITRLARGTPATPLLVNISVSIIEICWPADR